MTQALYEKMWTHEDYRKVAPGEHYAYRCVDWVKPPQDKRIVDFGCGIGGLLLEARAAGFEAYGVETNADAIAFARGSKGLPVFASVEVLRNEGGAGDGFFDVIVVRHTLEHLPNPAKTLNEFRNLLRPAGLLVIVVPHFSFVTRRILPNSMPRFSYGLVHKGHQYYFSRETLGRYLRDAGFRDLYQQTLGDTMWDTSNDYRLKVAEKSVELFIRTVDRANLKRRWSKKHALGAARKMVPEVQSLYYSYLSPAEMGQSEQLTSLETLC